MCGARRVRGCGVQCGPDFSAGWVIETCWKNSDNVGADSINVELHCIKISSPAQMFLPEVVTQHDRHGPAILLFLRQERASGNRLHAHRLCKTSGSVRNPGAHWFAGPGDDERETTG